MKDNASCHQDHRKSQRIRFLEKSCTVKVRARNLAWAQGGDFDPSCQQPWRLCRNSSLLLDNALSKSVR
ncbi:uncharacterized [Tachysurus ichikawai]